MRGGRGANSVVVAIGDLLLVAIIGRSNELFDISQLTGPFQVLT